MTVIFLLHVFRLKNIHCGYSLEVPHGDPSNKCHNIKQMDESIITFYAKKFA